MPEGPEIPLEADKIGRAVAGRPTTKVWLGITNDLERVEQLKQDGLTRSKYRHHVYRRDGLECYRCGDEIERKNPGGRGMFFCPNCQA